MHDQNRDSNRIYVKPLGSLNRTPTDLKFGPPCRHPNQISHSYLPLLALLWCPLPSQLLPWPLLLFLIILNWNVDLHVCSPKQAILHVLLALLVIHNRITVGGYHPFSSHVPHFPLLLPSLYPLPLPNWSPSIFMAYRVSRGLLTEAWVLEEVACWFPAA